MLRSVPGDIVHEIRQFKDVQKQQRIFSAAEHSENNDKINR